MGMADARTPSTATLPFGKLLEFFLADLPSADLSSISLRQIYFLTSSTTSGKQCPVISEMVPCKLPDIVLRFDPFVNTLYITLRDLQLELHVSEHSLYWGAVLELSLDSSEVRREIQIWMLAEAL
eukprot:Gb_18697 [translate_table: standard]